MQHRPASGPDGAQSTGRPKFQHDPNWRDLILFYEYFNGDTGAGLGPRHQTGGPGSSLGLPIDRVLGGGVDAKDLELSSGVSSSRR